MARQFQHVTVTFSRTVEQRQAVTVAVPPELDATTGETVARQLATKRIRATGWENADESAATIVGVGPA